MTLVQQLRFPGLHFQFLLKQNKTKQKSPWTGLCCLLSHHARCISFLLLIISWSFSSVNWLHSLTIHSCTFSTCPLTSALTVLLHVLSQRLSLRFRFWTQGLWVLLFLIFVHPLTWSAAVPSHLRRWRPASVPPSLISVCGPRPPPASEPYPAPGPQPFSFFPSSFSLLDPVLLNSCEYVCVWTMFTFPV